MSTSAMGVRDEIDLALPGIGRTGGFVQTARIVALLHEATHLVQDMTVGALLEQDRAFDASGARVFDIARTAGTAVSLPLIDHDDHFSDALDDALTESSHAHGLMDRDVLVQRYLRFDGTADGWTPPEVLTGRSLIEGLAAVRTAQVLVSRAGTDDDLAYLREFRDAIPLLPEQLSPEYRDAWELVRATLPLDLAEQSPREDDWPHGYAESRRAYVDAVFVLLADIALHIPPYAVMEDRLNRGINTEDDFLPVHRFFRAMFHFRTRNGFPEAADPRAGPDGFYRQIFDDLCDNPRLNWPTLEETNEAWLATILARRERRRSPSDGFRARLFWTRCQQPARVSLDDPLRLCLEQGLPVVHLTPTGLKLILGEQYRWPDDGRPLDVRLPHEERELDVYAWSQVDFRPWVDAPARMTTGESHADQIQRLPSFMQEIVFRALFRAVHEAMLSEDALVCPFAMSGCSAAQPGCANIRTTSTIPRAGCALKSYLHAQHLDGNDLRWQADLP